MNILGIKDQRLSGWQCREVNQFINNSEKGEPKLLFVCEQKSIIRSFRFTSVCFSSDGLDLRLSCKFIFNGKHYN